MSQKTIAAGGRFVFQATDNIVTLLDAVESTGAGAGVRVPPVAKREFQAYLANTTTPTATVVVEGSMDDVHWVVLTTITLSGADDTDGVTGDNAWIFLRGNVTAISGTSAAVTLLARV